MQPILRPVLPAVFGYVENGLWLPPRVDDSDEPFLRLVSQVNGAFWDAGANIQFYVKEIRRFTSNRVYPYLLLPDVET